MIITDKIYTSKWGAENDYCHIVETIKSTDWLSEAAKHIKIKPNKMYEIVKVGVRFWKIKATPEHLERLAELQSKAEAGDHSSQYLLGRAYYWGMGVKEDEKLGDLWFARANESCRKGEREKLSFQNSATTTQPQ